MATEDQSIDKYAELQEKIIASKSKPKPASPITECKDCGDEIPPKRKEAVPSTERCVDCEELFALRRK